MVARPHYRYLVLAVTAGAAFVVAVIAVIRLTGGVL